MLIDSPLMLSDSPPPFDGTQQSWSKFSVVIGFFQFLSDVLFFYFRVHVFVFIILLASVEWCQFGSCRCINLL